MHFTSKNVMRTWLFVTIVSITVVNVIGSGEKRLDLKIGFDLTQGPNGAPSLRIRDFEESYEANPRGKEDTTESKESKPEGAKVRADSFSDSNENGKSDPPPAKLDSASKERDSKESVKSNNEDDDDEDSSNSSDEGKKLSTRGLKAGDYEIEENSKIHGKYRESEEDSDKLQRRRKRHASFRSNGKWRKYRYKRNLRVVLNKDS